MELKGPWVVGPALVGAYLAVIVSSCSLQVSDLPLE